MATKNEEVRAIQKIANALEGLEETAKRRIVNFFFDQLNPGATITSTEIVRDG